MLTLPVCETQPEDQCLLGWEKSFDINTMTDLKNVFQIRKGLRALIMLQWIRYIEISQSSASEKICVSYFLLCIYIQNTTDIKCNCDSFVCNHLSESHLHSETVPLKNETQIAERYLAPQCAIEFQINHLIPVIFQHLGEKKKVSTLTIMSEASWSCTDF